MSTVGEMTSDSILAEKLIGYFPYRIQYVNKSVVILFSVC